MLERLPWTREGARRAGFVKLDQMLRALVAGIETVPDGFRVVAVPEIRSAPPL